MSSQARFQRLLQPGRIGGLRLKNRIIMPAMSTNYASGDGFVTPKLLDYYAERAHGGVGLVVVEAADVRPPPGQSVKHQLAIDGDKFLPGLSHLAQAIRRGGARAFLQLDHSGGRATTFFSGLLPVSPYTIGQPGYDQPRELSLEEIAEVVSRFGSAARLARQAGFDGVELQAAYGCLASQLLSAAGNRRTDQYGGPLNNRARFLTEVIGAIRTAAGPDFPLSCHLSGQEHGVEGGITLNEARQTAVMVERAGADAIHVTGWPLPAFRFPPLAEPPGSMLPLAEAVRKSVKVPVVAVGRITPEVAEQALARGQADFFAMGRALIAEPRLPLKLVYGGPREINPCVGCLHCLGSLQRNGTKEDGSLECALNPGAGRERATRLRYSRKPKRVLVVGGGPAGMMAAMVAAQRGHHVILCEQQDRLGGLLNLAAVPPHKASLQTLLEHMVNEVQRLQVDVRLNSKVTEEHIRRLAPYALIIAVGATPQTPKLPGVNGKDVMTALEVLSGQKDPGQRVVIIGGQMVGCETADFLAARGKQVTVLGRHRPIGQEVAPEYSRRLRLQRLAQAGVKLVEHVEVAKITRARVHCVKDGHSLVLPADSVVLATGASPGIDPVRQMEGGFKRVYYAGNSVAPRRVDAALAEGLMAARRI